MRSFLQVAAMTLIKSVCNSLCKQLAYGAMAPGRGLVAGAGQPAVAETALRDVG